MARAELMKGSTLEQPKYFRDMKLGDLAEITSGSLKGNFVYRVYNWVASLDDAESTWDDLHDNSIEVRILDKGEQIILTQE